MTGAILTAAAILLGLAGLAARPPKQTPVRIPVRADDARRDPRTGRPTRR